jgi:hypothetical protein
VLIWKQRIVAVAGKEGEVPGLLGSILVTSLRYGVAPRVSRRPLLPPSPYLALIRHLFPFPTVGMSAQHLSVNVSAGGGLVLWSCGALETQTKQWTTWQHHPWVMVVLSRVAWCTCTGNSRARMGNNRVVTHVVTRRGAWIPGVWHRGSHMQMPCVASALFGPPMPRVRGEPKCVMRSLLDQASVHPGMLLSGDAVAVSISLPCLRKVVMCLRMSDPLERAGHHRAHAMRRLVGRYVILFLIGSKGWSVVVPERVDFSVGMPDGILVTSS